MTDDMTCSNCDGTGYTTDGAGEEILCPMCDGASILLGDENTTDAD